MRRVGYFSVGEQILFICWDKDRIKQGSITDETQSKKN